MNYSKTIIVGKVGQDASMKYTPSGQAVTSFSVAVNEFFTKDNKQQKKTTWFRISCWGKLAENCNQYVKKGMEVLVEGRLTPDDQGNPRVFESNDNHKSSFEVNASTVQFGARADGARSEASAQELGGHELPPEDDIPF